ncbi:MAG: glycosyltransferase family 4 protein [Catalinimonas sp.]
MPAPSPQPIKVLVVSDYRSFHTVRPEAEIFIGLAGMTPPGAFEVTVMTTAAAAYAPRFEAAGVRVIDFQPQSKFDPSESGRIREELVRGDYDVLQLYNGKAIVNGLRAARGLPAKVVLYRGYTGHVHWYDPTAYLKYLHPRVDRVVCNSRGVAEMFRRQLGFAAHKAVVIRKGHRLAWYEDVAPLDLPTELGLPPDAFVVSCTANNRPMKGVPDLLSAFAQLPADLAHVHLLLMGRDMDTPANRRLLAGTPAADRVHFLGFRPDALRIVAASDVFALASIKGESITKSVIEAMALGVTPLITSIPGNWELVLPGRSGLVVPPHAPAAFAEALTRLARDPARCAEMGRAARRRVETHLNHKTTVEQYAALYRELADERRGAA